MAYTSKQNGCRFIRCLVIVSFSIPQIPRWLTPRLNLRLRGETPTSSRLTYGTACTTLMHENVLRWNWQVRLSSGFHLLYIVRSKVPITRNDTCYGNTCRVLHYRFCTCYAKTVKRMIKKMVQGGEGRWNEVAAYDSKSLLNSMFGRSRLFVNWCLLCPQLHWDYYSGSCTS
jgi:hypothetical protein